LDELGQANVLVDAMAKIHLASIPVNRTILNCDDIGSRKSLKYTNTFVGVGWNRIQTLADRKA